MKRVKELIFGSERFEDEFKRQMRLLITVTFAFTIAFTWRQTLFDGTQHFVEWLTNARGEVTLSILTSSAITLVSLILIYAAARWLKEY